MAGDRVAPHGGVEKKEGKTIGLPRAAPLVQPNMPKVSALSPQQQQQGKRSRVSTDDEAHASDGAGGQGSPKSKPAMRTAGGIQSKRVEKVKETNTSGLAGPSSPDAASSPPLNLRSQFEARDENGNRTAAQSARMEAYQRLAQVKCAEAVAAAQERVEKRRERRPKHVWWGFHYFWPREVLEGDVDQDPLDDPQFLKRVQKLMSNDRVIETFSIFDVDGSGSIDAKELRPVVQMVVPNFDPEVIDEMIESLDIDKDGEVDLWEFCVAIQKRTEGISEADMKMEMDVAFDHILGPEAESNGGKLDEAALRRVLQSMGGKSLDDKEFEQLLSDFDRQNIPLRNGATITLADLRKHAAFA